MEHRYSRRVEAGLKSIVFKRGLPVATGTIRDVSRGGLFIETDYDDVKAHQILEVEFHLKGHRRPTRLRVKTVVARTTGQGIGLELEETSDEGYEALCALMNELGERPARYSVA